MLYQDGDVCVQPSHWEGLGLPLLECQAAGLPLITTDMAPMHEHQPFGVVPATPVFAELTAEISIPVAMIQPEALADVLRKAFGRRIAAASRQARQFVVRHHNWKTAGPQIRDWIQATVASRRSTMPCGDLTHRA